MVLAKIKVLYTSEENFYVLDKANIWTCILGKKQYWSIELNFEIKLILVNVWRRLVLWYQIMHEPSKKGFMFNYFWKHIIKWGKMWIIEMKLLLRRYLTSIPKKYSWINIKNSIKFITLFLDTHCHIEEKFLGLEKMFSGVQKSR